MLTSMKRDLNSLGKRLRGGVFLAMGFVAAGAFGACSPEERQFEPSGSSGSGGSGGGGMVCTPDDTTACYSGPPGTEDIGLCKAGVAVCLPNGSGFGECAGEVLPQKENCLTPEDEACDGADTLECPPLGEGWLKTYGVGGAPQTVYDLAITPEGDIIVVGGFGATIDLGGGDIASTGNYDIFVAKIDPLGNLVWAKRYGDASLQQALAVAVDAAGSIYFGGRIYGAADFGNGVLLTSAGSDDAFVVKLDPNGGAIWGKAFGDAGSQQVDAIAVTKANQVVIAGSFGGTVSFGGSTFTSAGGDDIFVAKLDESGFHSSSRAFGSTGYEAIRDIALNDAGQVFVTGVFDTTLTIGGQTLTSQGSRDVFAAELSPNLSPLWANGWGDPSFQEAFDVAVAPNGDVYLAGAFEGSIVFANEVLNTAGASARALYVTRIASTGDAVVWAKSFGDATAVVGLGQLAVDTAADQVVIAGSFTGGIDFGGGLMTAVDSMDPFIAKLSGDGAHVASRFIPNAMGVVDSGNYVNAFALLPTGDPILGGNSRAPFLFGEQVIGEVDPKDGDAFLARLLP